MESRRQGATRVIPIFLSPAHNATGGGGFEEGDRKVYFVAEDDGGLQGPRDDRGDDHDAISPCSRMQQRRRHAPSISFISISRQKS